MNEFENYVEGKIGDSLTTALAVAYKEAWNRCIVGDGTGQPQGIVTSSDVHVITSVRPPRSTPWTCRRGLWRQW